MLYNSTDSWDLWVMDENGGNKQCLTCPGKSIFNARFPLDVSKGTYTRLTRLHRRSGLQHTAISGDGLWYVYPLRYKFGRPIKNFGLAKLVFNTIHFNKAGRAISFKKEFVEMPNGSMYLFPSWGLFPY
jgi:hypothetical protein